MPIEPPDKQFLTAACGYTQLEMFDEANEELEKVDPFIRAAPEILALRIEILSRFEKMGIDAGRRSEIGRIRAR
jgi:hypothetical protein